MISSLAFAAITRCYYNTGVTAGRRLRVQFIILRGAQYGGHGTRKGCHYSTTLGAPLIVSSSDRACPCHAKKMNCTSIHELFQAMGEKKEPVTSWLLTPFLFNSTKLYYCPLGE